MTRRSFDRLPGGRPQGASGGGPRGIWGAPSGTCQSAGIYGDHVQRSVAIIYYIEKTLLDRKDTSHIHVRKARSFGPVERYNIHVEHRKSPECVVRTSDIRQHMMSDIGLDLCTTRYLECFSSGRIVVPITWY
jgi:hypothetical protein